MRKNKYINSFYWTQKKKKGFSKQNHREIQEKEKKRKELPSRTSKTYRHLKFCECWIVYPYNGESQKISRTKWEVITWKKLYICKAKKTNFFTFSLSWAVTSGGWYRTKAFSSNGSNKHNLCATRLIPRLRPWLLPEKYRILKQLIYQDLTNSTTVKICNV